VHRDANDILSNCILRRGLIAFGWLKVCLGVVSIVVPGLTTTVILFIEISRA
jgi:uncharacterized membrane protein YbaN (DUF454 family)